MTDAAAGEFVWTVPAAHPAFAGHFPGHPIVPGVVLVDRAILFAEAWLGIAEVQWQLANAKFLSPVGPGETLRFTLQRRAGGVAFSVHADDATARTIASGMLNTPPAT